MHQQAISKGSFFQDYDVTLDRGSTEEAFELADNVIEGELSVGGQSHFYLETQCCIVVPRGEDGELEVFSFHAEPHGNSGQDHFLEHEGRLFCILQNQKALIFALYRLCILAQILAHKGTK